MKTIASKNRARKLLALAAFSVLAMASVARAGERTEIGFPDMSYPESISGTSDGTIYAGSFTKGGVSRVRPGAASAEPFIAPTANESMSTLGVYADETSKTLWVCSIDGSGFGVPPPGGSKPVALKAFDLATGAAKASYPLPGAPSLCNDAVVGSDGSVYVSESLQPHVLVLRPGAKALEVWKESPLFKGDGAQLDGITIAGDGNMYVNTFSGGKLFRIAMKEGKAGEVTELKTSRPLDHPDGMRPFGPKSLLLTEGGGHFSIVRLDGDNATLESVKEGLKQPCGVWQEGGTAWVLEGQQATLFNKDAGKPGPFKVYAVALPTN